MKKISSDKRSFGARCKRFFKHYFGLLVLAFVCAALITIVLTFGA